MVRVLALLMEGDEYGPRVIETICSHGLPEWIWGVHEFSEVPSLEAVLDEPEAFLPGDIAECDLVLSLGLPQELQALVPSLALRARAKAVIVALCDSSWVPPGLRKQMEEELEEAGLAYAFPKPLCSLEEVGDPYIDEFASRFGRPRLRIDVRGGVIRRVEVLRGSPCGSTWYIAEKLVGLPVEPREALWEELAKAHHTYPCLASMSIDPELGDAILHKGQYIIRDAVREALEKEGY